jgi:DNA-binding PadR family transcriptional regulator
MSTAPARSLTAFEHILLGYIAGEPQSGYGLKRKFNETPAAVYRPSPGALYPALRRLGKAGLLTVEDTVPARGHAQRLYRATDEGMRVHLAWLREPVNQSTIGSELGNHLMRFVMMEGQLNPSETRAFLEDLADALEDFVATMERFLQGPSAPAARNARLALEHGIAVHQASLDWARSTLTALA